MIPARNGCIKDRLHHFGFHAQTERLAHPRTGAVDYVGILV